MAILLALLLASLISLGALRRGSLSPSGAWAAVAVGTLVMGLGGWVAGLGLIGFFLTASALSHHRLADKAAVASDKFDKGERRDAVQVLANGGPAALLCVAHAIAARLSPCPALPAALLVAALGSLGAAAADTWATEIGVLAAAPPRLLPGLRRVPPGTSGAVSCPGLLGMLGGALLLAVISLGLGPALPAGGLRFPAVLLGGVAGAMADSLLGATVQERRACPRCGTATEQRTHRCGAPTRLTGGVAGLDNDWVNALATALGGAVAGVLYGALSHLPAATAFSLL